MLIGSPYAGIVSGRRELARTPLLLAPRVTKGQFVHAVEVPASGIRSENQGLSLATDFNSQRTNSSTSCKNDRSKFSVDSKAVPIRPDRDLAGRGKRRRTRGPTTARLLHSAPCWQRSI